MRNKNQRLLYLLYFTEMPSITYDDFKKFVERTKLKRRRIPLGFYAWLRRYSSIGYNCLEWNMRV